MKNPESEALSRKPPEQAKKASYHLEAIGIVVILFLIWQVVASFLLLRHPVSASDLSVQNILEAINKQRTLRNLTTLSPNDKLSVAAQGKSDDMIARKYFAHVDPEGNYIWPRIVNAGYTPYVQLGENLAIEFYTTDSLVNAWMNSPTHRANILNEGFKDQGMGLGFGSVQNGEYYSAVTNTFGTLLVKKVAQTPTPAPAPTPTATGSTTKKATPPAIATKKPTPVPPPSPSPLTPPAPHPVTAIRGADVDPSFTLSQPSTAASTSSPSTGSTTTFSTSPAVVQTHSPAPHTTPAQINRYAVLAFGALLLYFLLVDIKGMFKNSLEKLDKKINTIVLLVMSLVVIGLMYWL